jgi:hypothetical protein
MKNLPRALAALLLLLVALPSLRGDAKAAPESLVVVTAATLPIKDISISALVSVFRGEPNDYASGKRYIPINHPPNTPTRSRFDRIVLGLTPEAMGRFWVDRRIRDQSGPPKTVPSVELALRLVLSLPGGITYAPPALVTPKHKVLTVDGKLSGQKGYLLD